MRQIPLAIGIKASRTFETFVPGTNAAKLPSVAHETETSRACDVPTNPARATRAATVDAVTP